MNQATQYALSNPWRSLDNLSFATAPVRRKDGLSMTARKTLTRFLGVREGAGEVDPCELIGCYNNAGLAFYQQGRADRAREVSEAALALCEAGWKSTGWSVWCGSMLGPYVNVAKLASVGGDTRIALEAYRAYYRYLRCGGEIQIGGAVLTQEMIGVFSEFNAELKALRAGASAVYLADSAKAFLMQGDFEELFDFVERARSDTALSQASRRQAYVISEIRARALEGLGRDEEALAEYEELLRAIPQNLPGPLALWAAVARIQERVGNHRQALQTLEKAERQVSALPQLPELAVGRYYAQFAFAFERLLVGDAEGAYRGAHEALDSAAFGQHTVGTMRATVLLRLAASIRGTIDRDAIAHDLPTCKREIESTLYGFERAAALVHLAQAESIYKTGSEETGRLLEEAGRLVSWLDRCRFKAPIGFDLFIPPIRGAESACCESLLPDQHLDDLYSELLDYANSSTRAISRATASRSYPTFSGITD